MATMPVVRIPLWKALVIALAAARRARPPLRYWPRALLIGIAAAREVSRQEIRVEAVIR
jgi:hypothetical protein